MKKRQRGRPRKYSGLKPYEAALWEVINAAEKAQYQDPTSEANVKDTWRSVLDRIEAYEEAHGLRVDKAADKLLCAIEASEQIDRAIRRGEKAGDPDVGWLTTQGPQVAHREELRKTGERLPAHAMPWYEYRHGYRSAVVFEDELPELYQIPVLVHLDQKPSIWFSQILDLVKRWRGIRDGAIPYRTSPIGNRYCRFEGKVFRPGHARPDSIQRQIDILQEEKRESEAADQSRKPRTKLLPYDRVERFMLYVNEKRGEIGDLGHKQDPEKALKRQEAPESTPTGSPVDMLTGIVLNAIDEMDIPKTEAKILREHSHALAAEMQNVLYAAQSERTRETGKGRSTIHYD